MKLKKVLAAVLSAAMVVTSVVVPQDAGVVSAAGDETTPDTTTGLIAYYGFEDSLANGAKENAAATMNKGEAKYSSDGVKGKAFDFTENAGTKTLNVTEDGNIPAKAAIQMDVSPKTTSFTVSYWVKSEDAAYTAMFYEGICTYFKFGSNGAGAFPLGQTDMGSQDNWTEGRMGNHFRTGKGSQTGKWQMVTYTVSDKGVVTAYVDGKPVGEYWAETGYPENGEGWFAYTTDNGATYTNMFSDSWGNGDVGYLGSGDWFSNNFSGLMDEVYIYERELTAEDVTALYTQALPTDVDSLDITDAKKTLIVGETCQLTTTTVPELAAPAITWTSNDSNIATVDEKGLVTAVAVGTATITATTGNGKSDTCEITVSASDVKATSVTPTADKTDLFLNQTAQITYTFEPANITNLEEKKKAVTYSSSNEKVLTVDKTGKVTAVGDGTATVTVTFDGKTGTVTFNIDGNSELVTGGWWQAWTKGYELKDNSIQKFTLDVKGGNEVWNNFAAVFVNGETDGVRAPADCVAEYKEYGVIRGDNHAWGSEVEPIADKVKWDMGSDNADLIAVMKNATVDVIVRRTGDKIVYTYKAKNGDLTYDRVATFTHAVEVPTYVFFACDTSTVKVTKGDYLTGVAKTEAKEPTCTETGNQEYWTSESKENVFYKDADCMQEFENDAWKIAISPDKHTIVKVEKVEPNCATPEDGREAYYTCSGCHKNFKDEAGTEEVTDLSELDIPWAHTWVVDETNSTATCTEAGTVTRECSVCHTQENNVPVDKLGHDYGEWEVTTAATCTEAGSQTRTCKRANCTATTDGHVDTGTIPALGHAYDDGVVTEPTCTAGGYTTKTCGRCDDKKIENETDALGHEYGDWEVTKEATCTEAGTRTKTCTRTGCTDTAEDHAVTETIQALGHTITKIPAKAATTTTAGNIEYYSCSVCSKCFSDAAGTKEITIQSTVIAPIKDQGGTSEQASLELSAAKVTLYTGKDTNKAVITAKVTGASKTAEWTSSNPKVASVVNGTITAVAKGSATITVKANGITKTITVTVKNPTIKVAKGKKSVSKVTVKRKKSVKLNVTVSPSKSGMSLVKLSKKDKKVVKVTLKKGKLTIKGLKKGKATIKIKSGKGEKKIKVTVK